MNIETLKFESLLCHKIISKLLLRILCFILFALYQGANCEKNMVT